MEFFITPDLTAQSIIDERNVFRELYKNNSSHFANNHVRQKIFNLKSHLSSSANDQILYLNTNLTALIANAFADFVAGEGVLVDISNPYAQKVWDGIAEDNNFEELIYQMALDQSIVGYALARTRHSEEGVVIEAIPHNYFYPEGGVSMGNLARVCHLISEERGSSAPENAKNIQSYAFKDGVWQYTSGVFADAGKGGYMAMDEIEPEDLSFLPIVKVDNNRLSGEYFGMSDFSSVIDLMEEFNDRISQVSVQFIKHLNAKLALPESMGNAIAASDKSINELEFFGYRAGENIPEYIENKNPLISESLEYTKEILKLIASITKIPETFLGVGEKSGVENAETLKARFMRFHAKVKRKQRAFNPAIKKLIRNSLSLAGISDVQNLGINLHWNENITENPSTRIDNYATLVEQNIISKETALKETVAKDWNMEKTEAEKEILAQEKNNQL